MNSGPREPKRRPRANAADWRRQLTRCRRRRRPAIFRPPEVTPNRGDNVAKRRRRNRSGAGPFSIASYAWRMVVCAGLKRTAAPNRPTRWVRRETPKPKSNSGSAPARDLSRHNFGTTRKAGRPERGSTRTAQFFWKRHCCQMNLLQALPAGANRVASICAASLSGSKGVLDPKAQVHARRGVTH